ncbi:MAG: hypothetical protein AAF125_09695, partial [Chloroflexota bacterium]
NGGDVQLNEADGGTVLLKQKYMGKARGLLILVNESGDVIETLGSFGIAMSEIVPVLERFTMQLKENRTIERVVRQVNDKDWLIFIAGKFTTIVVVFNHEPSRYQTVVMQRMHKEFENANKALFEAGNFDPTGLVFPFLSFVTKSMRGPDDE